MKKILVCMLVCLFCAGVQAQKTAKIKATAVGYTGKVIDFEFIDNTANNQQFPFKDNQLMEFEVELKEPGLMKVNAWLWMIVCPGDEIEMAMEKKDYAQAKKDAVNALRELPLMHQYVAMKKKQAEA